MHDSVMTQSFGINPAALTHLSRSHFSKLRQRFHVALKQRCEARRKHCSSLHIASNDLLLTALVQLICNATRSLCITRAVIFRNSGSVIKTVIMQPSCRDSCSVRESLKQHCLKVICFLRDTTALPTYPSYI